MAAGFVAGLLQELQQNARYTFTVMLRPGTPEWRVLMWPPLAYWAVAIFYDILDRLRLPATERFRVVRRERGRENPLSVGHVVRRVMVQQLVQAIFSIVLYVTDPGMCPRAAAAGATLPSRAAKFVLGMFVMDAWQYVVHRYAHTNMYVYKHVHSVHHTLLIPYAYAALYNSVLEGLALDTLGGGVVLWTTGIDCNTAAALFTFGMIKTVLDHSGYRWPVHPLHGVMPNSAAFHDVHHDIRYIKTNFSQPFFTHWDWLLGTFVDPADVHLSQQEVDEQQRKQRGGEGEAGGGAAAPKAKAQ